jgi:hypothetical protein
MSLGYFTTFFLDLDDSVTGDHGERDDDEELISDDDEDDDEEYDKYPDPDYLVGNKKRRNSETSELSRVSAAEEDVNVDGDLSSSIITNYEFDPKHEVFGDANDQTEEISDENKSIVWFLVKQVRPGMDLSKVVLPTFILEPRSFLDKISDYYYHADILSM